MCNDVMAHAGSTSEPKGVMITHGNLADNLTLIVNGLDAVDDTVVVSWLPQVTNDPPASMNCVYMKTSSARPKPFLAYGDQVNC